MSGDPKPPDASFPLPPQQAPRFASPTAPTAPGIPSVMPVVGAFPPAPGAVMPAVGFAAPVAPPAAPQGPVLGVRDHYQFAEEPVGQRVQVTILESPPMPPELPSPSKIDPGLEATRVALEAQLARNAIASLPYVPPVATRWFRFSPLELFMEQVLARRLWTVE